MLLSHTFADPFIRAAVFVLFRVLAVLKQEPVVMLNKRLSDVECTAQTLAERAGPSPEAVSQRLAGKVACKEAAHTSKLHWRRQCF